MVRFLNIDGHDYMIIFKNRGILIVDVNTKSIVFSENEEEFLFDDVYGSYSSEL